MGRFTHRERDTMSEPTLIEQIATMVTEDTEDIKLAHYLNSRRVAISGLVEAEINQSYFRRKTIMQNKTKESETALVTYTNKVEQLTEQIDIMTKEIEKLKGKK